MVPGHLGVGLGPNHVVNGLRGAVGLPVGAYGVPAAMGVVGNAHSSSCAGSNPGPSAAFPLGAPGGDAMPLGARQLPGTRAPRLQAQPCGGGKPGGRAAGRGLVKGTSRCGPPSAKDKRKAKEKQRQERERYFAGIFGEQDQHGGGNMNNSHRKNRSEASSACGADSRLGHHQDHSEGGFPADGWQPRRATSYYQ